MASIPEINGGRSNLSPSQVSRFCAADSGGNSSTESQVQRTVREAGTYSKLWIKVFTNTITAASTLRFRVNGGNGNQSLTIPLSTTGEFEDASNTDAVVAGDLVNTDLTIGGTGTTFSPNAVGMLFAATSNTSIRYSNQTYNLSTASTTFFIKTSGQNGTNISTTEALQQVKMKTGGTIKNLNVVINSNGRGTSTTYGSRLNGAPGNLTLSVGAGATGQFEDTSNSDTVVSGDLICRFGTTGSGAGTIGAIVYTTLETTDGTTQLIAGRNATSVNFGVTNYFGLTGVPAPGITTESETNHRIQMAATLSQYEVYVGTNTVNGASTWKLRKNAGAANGSVSITASTTGWFEDASNSDAVIATDLLGYQLITGGSSGALTLESSACKLAQPVAGGFFAQYYYQQQAAA